MSSTLASCSSQFAWMKNDLGQDPCTIAAWLIMRCQDSSSDQPASLAPLTTNPSYKAPNGTSANGCTCSWAFYNNIEACTVCQDFAAESYSDWSSSCDVLGQSSTTTYWQAGVSFSDRTKLPTWSILDPSNWSSGTFNATQAEEIAEQNLPDVSDASASQPSVTFASQSASAETKKTTNVGAIAGGVVAGVLVLAAGTFALWFVLYRRRGRLRKRGPRQHVDLDADGEGILGGSPRISPGGNPLTAHLRSQSLGSCPASPRSPMTMQQVAFQGYPVASRNNNNPPMNAVVGVTRTRQNSRDSIPTVAEQLDEKKRIRAERANPSAIRRSSTGNQGLGHSHGQQAGSSSRNTSTSIDDLRSSGSNTAVISHAISRSLSQSQVSATAVGTGTGANTNANASATQLMGIETGDHRLSAVTNTNTRTKRASRRRLSLKRVPWNRRRTVMNLGSDAGSDGAASPPANAAPLPLGGTVAIAGETTTPGEVMAAVPGARLPSARDRENPPPGYMSTS